MNQKGFVIHFQVRNAKNPLDLGREFEVFKINIYNLAQKLNHRIYNLSLGKKFTNGFIRNGHDVIEISDRDYVRLNKSINLFGAREKFHSYLVETFKNYNPDLVLFGHSNHINQEILIDFRTINKNIIISQWNEDPLMDGLGDTSANLSKVVSKVFSRKSDLRWLSNKRNDL